MCFPSCGWQIAQLIARGRSQLLAFWCVLVVFMLLKSIFCWCQNQLENSRSSKWCLSNKLPYPLIRPAINVPFFSLFCLYQREYIYCTPIFEFGWIWMSLYCWSKLWKVLLATQNAHIVTIISERTPAMASIWGSLYKNYDTKNLISKNHCIQIVSSIKNQNALHNWIEAAFLHVISKIQWICMTLGKPRPHKNQIWKDGPQQHQSNSKC